MALLFLVIACAVFVLGLATIGIFSLNRDVDASDR